MSHISIKTAAKLNLMLKILGKYPNNYHSMQMVNTPVDIYDIVTIEENKSSKENIEIQLNNNLNQELKVETKDNIAYKAAIYFQKQTGKNLNIKITIDKNIPHQFGMGGGSADAAAVLQGLYSLYKNQYNLQNSYYASLSEEEITQIAYKLGADIPYCLFGKDAIVQGIGEKIQLATIKGQYYFVLINPEYKISTKEAFENFDKENSLSKPIILPEIITREDIAKMTNDFDMQIEKNKDLKDIVSYVNEIAKEYKTYIKSSLSGSGSCYYIAVEDKETAQQIKTKIKSFISCPVYVAGKLTESMELN